MEIPDGFLYEYAVVRYVPRIDREEFVNIGIIMMSKRRRWMRGGIRLNRNRILAFDPLANIDSLCRQASIFTRDDLPSGTMPVEERYRWLTAVKSAILQVSPSHPGLLVAEGNFPQDKETAIEMLNKEFDRLFEELVS